MSLINDALQRAQQDKARNDGVSLAAGPIKPPPDDVFARAPRRRVGKVAVMAALAVVVVGMTGWRVFSSMSGRTPAPAQAAAAPYATSPNHIVADDSPAAARTPSADKSGETSAAKPSAKTPPASATVAKATPAKTPATAPATPVVAESPAAVPATANAPSVEDSPAMALATESPAIAAVPSKSAGKPQVPAGEVDESAYKLTGIMRGPDGATAVINGEIVGEGQTVKNATVVKINRNSVVLQSGSQTFTIHM